MFKLLLTQKPRKPAFSGLLRGVENAFRKEILFEQVEWVPERILLPRLTHSIMKDITHGKLEQHKGLLSILRTHLESGVAPAWEYPLLSIMKEVFSVFFAFERQEAISEIRRVTVNRRLMDGNNSRLSNVSQIKYPPADRVAKYGRCNIKNFSVLYAGFDHLTIMSELKPELGDLITISYWENKHKLPMRCFSIIGNQPGFDRINRNTSDLRGAFEKEIKKFPDNLKELFERQVNFLADAFSKRIESGANLDYLFSSYFSGKLFCESGAEAIIYPSVQQQLSFENIAIRADVFNKVFSLKKLDELIVLASPFGDNGFSSGSFCHVLASAKSVGADGALIWENGIIDRGVAEFAKTYGVS